MYYNPNENLIKNQEYQGEKLHPNLAYGPTKSRGCKDICFLLLYILFWAGLILIAIVALQTGDPKRLAQPFDPNGVQCGYNQAEKYPYLYFAQSNILSGKQYACVKHCLSQKDIDQSKKLECLVNSQITDCSQLSEYPTFTFVSICIPQLKESQSNILKQLNIDSVDKWMSDLKTSWPIILAVTILSFVFAVGFLLLMRLCAGAVTWLLIIGYFVLLIVLGSLCVYKSKQDMSDLPESLQNQNLLEGLGIFFLVLAGFSLLLFICFFNKIKRAVAIMKAASDFTNEVPQSFMIPLIMYILIIVFFTFWIVISLYLFSSGEILSNPTSPFASIKWNTGVKRCLLYYLFGLFWNIEFVIGMSQLVIATCVCMWYFSHRPGGEFHSPVSKSFCWAFTFHLGSVCLGSMIISIVMLINFLMNMFYEQVKKTIQGNESANFCFKCCQCYLQCFEKTIRFINTNAYIMIGLSGDGFCTSAKQAFYLIVRNASQFSITHGIGKIFVYFGKLFICSLSTIIGYIILINIPLYNDKLYSPAVPVLMFGIISYTVGSIFMNIYGIAADSLLMCLCSDKELNQGKAASCPPTLQEFENEYM